MSIVPPRTLKPLNVPISNNGTSGSGNMVSTPDTAIVSSPDAVFVSSPSARYMTSETSPSVFNKVGKNTKTERDQSNKIQSPDHLRRLLEPISISFFCSSTIYTYPL